MKIYSLALLLITTANHAHVPTSLRGAVQACTRALHTHSSRLSKPAHPTQINLLKEQITTLRKQRYQAEQAFCYTWADNNEKILKVTTSIRNLELNPTAWWSVDSNWSAQELLKALYAKRDMLTHAQKTKHEQFLAQDKRYETEIDKANARLVELTTAQIPPLTEQK